MKTLGLIAIMILVSGCASDDFLRPLGLVSGYKPSYIEPVDAQPSEQQESESLITSDYQKKLAEFTKDYCDKKRVKKSECRTKFDEMLTAKIQIKYPRANFQSVNLWCKANLIECETGTNLEAAISKSHEEALSQERLHAYRARTAEAQRQEVVRAEQESALMLSIAEAFKPKPTTRCTTRQVGYDVQTECKEGY